MRNVVNKPMSVTETYDERLDRLEKRIEEVFHGLIAAQQDVRRVWNVMNAVILCLQNKGLVTNDALAEAGRQLWTQHQRNMEATNKAIAEKRKLRSDEIEKAPIEELIATTNKGVKEAQDG